MKRILLLCFGKAMYTPYLEFYKKILRADGLHIDCLFWNRDGKADVEMPVGFHAIYYKRYVEDRWPLARKLSGFWGYRRYARRLLHAATYDFIIVLHTPPAFLLRSVLTRRYDKKYLLDYRDYTYERIGVYRRAIQTLCEHAAAVYSSSAAFVEYLPSLDTIYPIHNYQFGGTTSAHHPRSNVGVKGNPLVIRFWGFVTYPVINCALIRQLANDERFEIHFHGRYQAEGEQIKAFAKSLNAQNVFFHGEYRHDDRETFAVETDILQNMQDYNDVTKNATSNKFYDGAAFHVPQICTKGSNMGKMVESFGLGLTLDANAQDIAGELLKYYATLDPVCFINNCDAFIAKCEKEQGVAESVLTRLAGGNKGHE